jgi:hypothetical protein
VPRFCRHGRFIERCPICRDTVPGLAPVESGDGHGARRKTGGSRVGTARRAGKGIRGGGKGVRVYSDGALRGEDDGYRSELVPGLRNSPDAQRLAEEIAFAAGRLQALDSAPVDLYAELRLQEDRERVTWMCFLAAYLSPLEGEDPFRGVRQVAGQEGVPATAGELPDLTDVPLGPRTSHDPARGTETLRAYLHWAQRAGSQVSAFSGDPAWTEERRFQRLFERLALPGFGRMGRYDMLVTLGHLGLYRLRADSLHFADTGGAHPSGAHAGTHAGTQAGAWAGAQAGAWAGAQAGARAGDLATLAAKRLFGIGDPLILERRAQVLAHAAGVPLEALDLALANWGVGERATVGVGADSVEDAALERAQRALEV